MAIYRNREELRKELQRERPKKEIILSLCRQTFYSRRAEVLSEANDVCVASLLTEFPEFWKPYVVYSYLSPTPMPINCPYSPHLILFLLYCKIPPIHPPYTHIRQVKITGRAYNR